MFRTSSIDSSEWSGLLLGLWALGHDFYCGRGTRHRRGASGLRRALCASQICNSIRSKALNLFLDFRNHLLLIRRISTEQTLLAGPCGNRLDFEVFDAVEFAGLIKPNLLVELLDLFQRDAAGGA